MSAKLSQKYKIQGHKKKKDRKLAMFVYSQSVILVHDHNHPSPLAKRFITNYVFIHCLCHWSIQTDFRSEQSLLLQLYTESGLFCIPQMCWHWSHYLCKQLPVFSCATLSFAKTNSAQRLSVVFQDCRFTATALPVSGTVSLLNPFCRLFWTGILLANRAVATTAGYIFLWDMFWYWWNMETWSWHLFVHWILTSAKSELKKLTTLCLKCLLFQMKPQQKCCHSPKSLNLPVINM